MHFKNVIFICCWIGWCELSNNAKLIVMKIKMIMTTLNKKEKKEKGKRKKEKTNL